MAEEKVKQNVALEIYEDYFHETDPATDTEKYEVKTIISYPDPSKKSGIPKRPVISYWPREQRCNLYLNCRSAASGKIGKETFKN